MLGIAAIGVVLGLLDTFPVATFGMLFVLNVAFLAWLAVRRRPVVAMWGFGVVALGVNLGLLVLYGLQPEFHHAMLLFLAVLVLMPVVPGLGAAWVGDGRGHGRWGRAVVVAGAVALAFSMILTRWPLFLGFRLSSPALNRLADRIEAGGTLRPNERAGLYRVRATTNLNGHTALVIDPDPGGISAFVRRKGSAKGARTDQLEDKADRRWWYLDQD
jgi:hypothetical protein